MCGISAIVGPELNPESDTISRMVERLRHRGPDDRGFKRLPGCHLGHTRLSIIDLQYGAQPMSDGSGRYWIAFNGEIYNYRELRDILERDGTRFSTQSDTEVILASYIRWGPDCLDKFRGMFAFVIWDAKLRRLFAARDLFGEKPLYYATAVNGNLMVASEIKALLATGQLEIRLSRDAVDAYLAQGYVPPDRTVYENIQVLSPGHHLIWIDGKILVSKYWSPRFKTRSLMPAEAAVRLKELIAQAVRRQMVADVPVGAFLSGGLDSSTIVAYMKQEMPNRVKTFSVGFGDWINELPYARQVAVRYGTDHHEIDLGLPPVGELLQRLVDVYDEPFADSSGIPTYQLAGYARKFVKVVLTGDGGDEIFGGYGWYPPLAMSERVSASKIRWALARLTSRVLRERLRKLSVYSVAAGLACRWSDMLARREMSTMVIRRELRRRLWDQNDDGISVGSSSGVSINFREAAGLNEAFFFDLTHYLPGDILVKVDRAAMAHGLETRAPFLDRDLVEFTLTLPSTMKVSGIESKILMKQACGSCWPDGMENRAKQGFGAPYDQWLKRPDVDVLSRHVFSADSKLQGLLPGAKKNMKRLSPYGQWILLTLGLWLERSEATH